MKTSEKTDKLFPALFQVKLKLQSVSKSANNPFFKSKYADLNTHLEAVEELLHENGLMLLQPAGADLVYGVNCVSSTIVHVESGQFISSTLKLVGDVDMQKSGSAITYARRYTLGSLLSMKAEDDDGEAAVGRTRGTTVTKTEATTPAARPSFRKAAVAAKPAPVAEEASGDDI